MENEIKTTVTSDFMNAKEVAAYLHVSLAAVYTLMNSDDFPTLHIASKKMVSRQNLERWIETHTNKVQNR